jgi:hypothetical protein
MYKNYDEIIYDNNFDLRYIYIYTVMEYNLERSHQCEEMTGGIGQFRDLWLTRGC